MASSWHQFENHPRHSNVETPITAVYFSMHVVKSRADIEKEITSLEAMIGEFQLDFTKIYLNRKASRIHFEAFRICFHPKSDFRIWDMVLNRSKNRFFFNSENLIIQFKI